ncbi:MAG: PIN domain-containing protein [Peptococcaceae bacterium]|nr:PIN domain-containing protein [Peptococcaceae bacterium]
METVLVSAGIILALLDADSPLHGKALAELREMRSRGAVPLLTNFIAAEAFSLLSSALGPDAGRTWLRHNIWPVERVTEADEERAREIILEAGNGGKGPGDISYTDATTIAVMERLKVSRVLSFGPVPRGMGLSPGAVK